MDDCENEEIEFEVEDEQSGRLDVALCSCCARNNSGLKSMLSRSHISRLIRDGLVRVNNDVITKPSFQVYEHDFISLPVLNQKPQVLTPDYGVELNVLLEDDSIIVIDKPPGLSVHPGNNRRDEPTLAHGLLAYVGNTLSSVGHPLRPGIVHRLDKDTSGVMVVAKTTQAYLQLSQQFVPPRTIHRKYFALTQRLPVSRVNIENEIDGFIDLDIRRNPNRRTIMQASSGSGKHAKTHWELVQALRYGYELKLVLETGRTHQIRVHLQSRNAPIIGDAAYGYRPRSKDKRVIDALRQVARQMLHAHELNFLHPLTGEDVTVTAPVPSDYVHVRDILSAE